MGSRATQTGENPNLSKTDILVGLALAVILGGLIYLLENVRQSNFVNSERHDAELFAENLREKLSLALSGYELRANGVATAFELDETINQDRFSDLADRFMLHDKSILNLAFLKNAVIQLVHPLETNRNLIGSDLHFVEEQFTVLERIHRTGQVETQGPVQLLQGGTGFIVRMPVDVLASDSTLSKEMNSVAVVIDAEAVFQKALKQTEKSRVTISKYLAALTSIDAGGNVLGDSGVFDNSPVVTSLELPGLRLKLGVVPQTGWGANYSTPWKFNLGLVILATLALYVAYVLRLHGAERRRAQVQLEMAIDSLTDGFVLFDSEDRLVLCNKQYFDIHDKCADAIEPGARYEDILCVGIECGQFPVAVGREEEWLAEQLKPPGRNGRDFEVALDGNRWIRVYEKSTPGGGRVGLQIDITRQVEARKRAEEAERLARRATNQLFTAVEALPDGFVLFDADDRMVLCNEKYKEFYRRSAKAMVPGAQFEDILRFGLKHGQYAEAVGREEEWLMERLAAHKAVDVTVEQELEDGRWLRILERPTPDGGRVGLRIDITDQVQSRERAEMAEQRLRDAINALPAGFLLFDKYGRLAIYNDTYCKMYEKSAPIIRIGVTSTEVLRFGLAKGEYPEATGRQEEWLQELSKRKASGAYEWEYPLHNGKWIRSYDQPTSDGGRVGIRVDITELKIQQADLEAANADMRLALEERDAAKSRFSHVAEISNDWFWEQDERLRFTYISGGFDRFLGRSSKFALGKTRDEMYKDKPRTLKSADWKWLAAKMAARAPFQNFVYCADADGDKDKWLRISGAPIFDNDGNFKGYRGVGTDVSVLYNALRRAESASIAKTNFLNVMSHELRTPLTVVLGYNAFLAKPSLLTSVKALESQAADGTLTAEAAVEHLRSIKTEISGYAEKMQDSGQHLLRLINEMLDLGKIDAGKLKIDRQAIELEPLISSVADQFSNMAHQKSLKMSVETNGETVTTDEMRLRQILINLVGNALKFTEQGHVKIRTGLQGDDIFIAVEDSGCGVPKEQHAAIFDQFSQVDSSATRKKGGTGLGLTISKRLVELLGGTLTLDSEVGVGSTFSITLPATDVEIAPKSNNKEGTAA